MINGQRTVGDQTLEDLIGAAQQLTAVHVGKFLGGEQERLCRNQFALPEESSKGYRFSSDRAVTEERRELMGRHAAMASIVPGVLLRMLKYRSDSIPGNTCPTNNGLTSGVKGPHSMRQGVSTGCYLIGC